MMNEGVSKKVESKSLQQRNRRYDYSLSIRFLAQQQNLILNTLESLAFQASCKPTRTP
jgi:hypothetical protein